MHTPGPWQVVGSRITTLGNDKEREVVARVVAKANIFERDANAEYIVKACNHHDELLEACKAVIAEGYTHNLNLSEKTLELVNASIAKAEGED